MHIEQVAQADGGAFFDLGQFLNEVFVALLLARDPAGRAPDVRLAAIFAHQPRRAAQAGRALPGLFAARGETIARRPVQSFERQAYTIRATVVFDAENIGDFVRQPDRGEQTAVAVNFVNAHRRHHLFDAGVLHDEEVAQRRPRRFAFNSV